MKQLIVEVERLSIASALQNLLDRSSKDKRFKGYSQIFFIGDDNFICDYLMSAVNNSRISEAFKSVKYVLSGNESEYRKNTLNSQNVATVSVNEMQQIKENKSLVFFFVDTTDLQRKDAVISSLHEVKRLLSGTKNSRCVMTALLPEIEIFPGEATALSERELSFFMEKLCKKTPESEYYFELEKICRGFVRDGGLDVLLLRFDNVFAPDRFHTPSFDMEKTVSECVNGKEIVIADEDEELVTSATYIRNACYAVFNSAYFALKGHVYNVAYNALSVSDIKQGIYNGYKDCFSLSINLNRKAEKRYNALNSLVFSKLKIKPVLNLQSAVNLTVAYLTGYPCPNLAEKVNVLYRD